MKLNFSRVPFLPKIILYLVILLFLFSSCQSKFNKLVGKVYVYEDSIVTLTAGFDEDTLYYIVKDSLRPYFHKSKYKTNKIDDSTFVLELSSKPAFWDKNTWEIIIDKNEGFYSKESNRHYKLYSDSLIVKKAF